MHCGRLGRTPIYQLDWFYIDFQNIIEIKKEKDIKEIEKVGELVIVKEQKLSNKLSVRISKPNYLHNNDIKDKIEI